MMRLPDWETRLAAAIDKHRTLPFELGVSDCFELTMDAVEAITGENPCVEFCGSYRTEMDIARILSKLKLRDVGDFLAKYFSDEIAPSFASRGDLVAVKQGEQIAAAICIGQMILGKATSGLTFTSRSFAIRAFRI
jgi:hypothetical protein